MATNCTLFEYLYRDAGNFKAFGAVAFDGALSEEELAAVRSRFPGDGFFIAEQLGVPPLYGQLYTYSGGPTPDDHCWHEFLDIKSVGGDDLPANVSRGGNGKDFLERLIAVREWEQELSPHFCLDGFGRVAQ
jgi:hypothetical protein